MYICRSCLARGKRVFLFISLSTSSIYDFSEIFVLLVYACARFQLSAAMQQSANALIAYIYVLSRFGSTQLHC